MTVEVEVTNTLGTALVTGAARRIGARIASELHAAGYDVVLHYGHSAAAAHQLKAELNALRDNSATCLSADLGDVVQVRALAAKVLEQSPDLTLLVNNASTFYRTPLADIDIEAWDHLIGGNLRGPLFLCQALAETLTSNGGNVVNIVDIYADQPLAQHSLYCASKAGLAMITRSLAQELAPRVRVNGIAPGAILWPEDESGFDQDFRATLLNCIPLERLGDPADIAAAVLFLARDATYLTGQVIAVDGGQSA